MQRQSFLSVCYLYGPNDKRIEDKKIEDRKTEDRKTEDRKTGAC